MGNLRNTRMRWIEPLILREAVAGTLGTLGDPKLGTLLGTPSRNYLKSLL